MCRRAFILLCLLGAIQALAQQRSTGVEVVSAGAYDTTYIESYYNDLVLTALMRTQGNEVELTNAEDRSVAFSTNDAVQYGFGLDLRWLTLEAAFTIPGWSAADPEKGVTESSGLGFGLTGRKWWFRNFLTSTKGYHVTDPLVYDSLWTPGKDYPVRNDLEQLTYMASINHGFNGARYSHNAALWQLERQKRSAGSWTAGATMWYNRIRNDSTLIPFALKEEFSDTTQFDQMERMILGLTGGYTHTFVMGRWFLNLMLVPGITAERHRYRIHQLGDLSTEWAVGGYAEGRFSVGYNAERWYIALSGSSYAATGTIADRVDIGIAFNNARFAAGVRLRKPAIPFLQKVGL